MEQIIVQILISLVTAIFGFLIGLANNKLNLRREIQKERFESLYLPFTQLYDKTHMAAAYNFEDFTEEVQKEYAEILINNMTYATKFTRNYIIQFMMLYNDVFIKASIDKDNIECLNKTFNTICELIYGEFDYLENKLYYSLDERIRNYVIKRKYRKIAKKDSVKNVFMNNL